VSDRDESGRNSDPRGDFQRSVERLEKAVQGFVSAANDQVTSRAADFVDTTAERLEREMRDRRARDSGGDRDESRRERKARHREERWERRRRRREARWRARFASVGTPGYRTSRLYQDKSRQKVAGVCAGIARYFGVEVWVVRGIAITGLIFMPSVVVPAYFIAMWILPKSPDGDSPLDSKTPSATPAREDHASPVPELGARLSPRRSLRNVQAEFDQIELKLRRMESHVTSGQFELQRELKRIDA
jgi:phage shock protein C